MNFLKSVPSVSRSNIQRPALPKNPSTKRSPRKRILQEDGYVNFIANDTASVFNNITEKNSLVGNSFIRWCSHCCVDRLQAVV